MNNERLVVFLKFGCLAASAALIGWTIADPQRGAEVHINSSFYIMMAIGAIWLSLVIRWIVIHNDKVVQLLKENCVGIAAALILTCIVFVSIGPSFRVVGDEHDYLLVARSMLFEKKVHEVSQGRFYFMNFQPETSIMTIRMFLFPFLTYLLHVLLGYRVENVFVLNFLALFGFLSLVHMMVRPLLGRVWSVALLIFLCSQGVITQGATSGGYELVSILFMGLAFAALRIFLRDQGERDLELAWMSILVFAYSRHETFILAGAAVIILAALGYLKKGFVTRSWIYPLTPILAAPLFWHRFFNPKLPGEDYIPAGESYFQIKAFLENNRDFLANLFNFKFYLPYCNVVNLLGCVGLIYFAGLWFFSNRLKTEKWTEHLTFISSAVLIIQWTIFTSYAHGFVFHPLGSRYYSFGAVVLSIVAVFLLRYIPWLHMKRAYAIPIAVALFFLYHPSSVEGRYSNTYPLRREYYFVTEFLKTRPNRNFLIVSNSAQIFNARNYGAIYFYTANNDPQGLLDQYNNRLFEDIYVVQMIGYETKIPIEGTELNDLFKLEPILELQNTGEVFMRISRVVNKKPS